MKTITVALFVFTFMVGMHNLDLGQNMRYLNAEYGLNLGENNLVFKNISAETTYMSGLVLMLFSFLFFVVYACHSQEIHHNRVH